MCSIDFRAPRCVYSSGSPQLTVQWDRCDPLPGLGWHATSSGPAEMTKSSQMSSLPNQNSEVCREQVEACGSNPELNSLCEGKESRD